MADERHEDASNAVCGCDYELVEDGAVQRKRWFHDPDCPLGPGDPVAKPDAEAGAEASAARVRVREDVLLESGEVLQAGTVCKVFAETEDAFGIEWVDPSPSAVLHSMAIARHKVEVVA